VLAAGENFSSVWPAHNVVAVVEENEQRALRLVLVELEKRVELWARDVKYSGWFRTGIARKTDRRVSIDLDCATLARACKRR
jgi:hypothetical protein